MPPLRDPHASEPHVEHLDDLDEALLGIRRVFQRPGYRRRLLASLSKQVELATLRLLRVVQRSEDPPTIGTVADALTVGPSTASRVADRAVELGYLQRRACADDRRRARLELTPSGIAVLDEATAHRRALLAEVTVDWDPDEVGTLVDLLAQLQAGFDRLEGST